MSKRVLATSKSGGGLTMKDALNLMQPSREPEQTQPQRKIIPIKDNISGVIVHGDLAPKVDENIIRKTISPNYERKNPITQPIEDYDQPMWKPSVRKSPIQSLNTFDKPSSNEIFQSKARGACNEHDSIKKNEEWRSGTKLVQGYYSNKGKNLDVDFPRGVRRIPSAYKERNPVVEGDREGYKLPQTRPEIRASQEYQNMNKKGLFLPGEVEKKPRQEREAYELRNSNTKEIGIFGPSEKRLGVNEGVKQKHLGQDMKNTVLYSNAPAYREQGVATKVNNLDVNDVIYASLERSKGSYKPLKRSDVTKEFHQGLRQIFEKN